MDRTSSRCPSWVLHQVMFAMHLLPRKSVSLFRTVQCPVPKSEKNYVEDLSGTSDKDVIFELLSVSIFC